VLALIPGQFQIAFSLLALLLVFLGLRTVSKKLAASDW
jgi:hypothetical protein